mmetsp:Transcript_44582/g.133285  ORF Transcript_44582/g.133285 Transcript_44582/m.133285 type:complete len:310 (-) Transcript_44582:182-1111(-)
MTAQDRQGPFLNRVVAHNPCWKRDNSEARAQPLIRRMCTAVRICKYQEEHHITGRTHHSAPALLLNRLDPVGLLCLLHVEVKHSVLKSRLHKPALHVGHSHRAHVSGQLACCRSSRYRRCSHCAVWLGVTPPAGRRGAALHLLVVAERPHSGQWQRGGSSCGISGAAGACMVVPARCAHTCTLPTRALSLLNVHARPCVLAHAAAVAAAATGERMEAWRERLAVQVVDLLLQEAALCLQTLQRHVTLRELRLQLGDASGAGARCRSRCTAELRAECLQLGGRSGSGGALPRTRCVRVGARRHCISLCGV